MESLGICHLEYSFGNFCKEINWDDLETFWIFPNLFFWFWNEKWRGYVCNCEQREGFFLHSFIAYTLFYKNYFMYEWRGSDLVIFFTKNGENRFTEMKNQMKVYTKRSIFKSVYIRRWVGGKIEKFGLIRIKKIQERNYYSY